MAHVHFIKSTNGLCTKDQDRTVAYYITPSTKAFVRVRRFE